MIENENSIISIREISAATGISTDGIYHHFSNKEEIYNELTERYYINYYKFNIDELSQIKGNAKVKIHDIMAEMFRQKQNGIEIESDDGKIDYRAILLSLTANAFVYENSRELWQGVLEELKEFFIRIIEEGQKNSEIRQDLPAEDIAESLILMYMGIQYKWDIYLIDDMLSAFEDNFNLEWESIRFEE